MPKLYFRYGTMNSSKTANLLMTAHNYETQNKKVLLIKPNTDIRFDTNKIISRAGLEKTVDLCINETDNLLENELDYSSFYCILVDEVQFLTPKQIEELRIITLVTPVICYGLRTDYKTKLFPASKRLMEIADEIQEIKTICHFCNKKSIVNLKYNGTVIIKDGTDSIDLGAEEKYLSSCWKCWYKNTTI